MLTLPIKKKWFDMIASGEKKEEYREIKEYYETRFQNLFGAITIYPSSIFVERYEYELLQGNDVPEEIRQDRVQEIIFRNGYSKNSPQLKCKCILRLGKGKEKMEAQGWHNCYDAEPDKPGIYRIYRRNGSKGKAYYKGNHIWQQLTNNGWDFTWWREMKGSDYIERS